MLPVITKFLFHLSSVFAEVFFFRCKFRTLANPSKCNEWLDFIHSFIMLPAYNIGLPSSLRFMRLPLLIVCFYYCLCDFVCVFYFYFYFLFIATMSFAGYYFLLSVLFCLLSLFISDFRFDLVWFRLSWDHGWIRSGSVNNVSFVYSQVNNGVLYVLAYYVEDNLNQGPLAPRSSFQPLTTLIIYNCTECM